MSSYYQLKLSELIPFVTWNCPLDDSNIISQISRVVMSYVGEVITLTSIIYGTTPTQNKFQDRKITACVSTNGSIFILQDAYARYISCNRIHNNEFTFTFDYSNINDKIDIDPSIIKELHDRFNARNYFYYRHSETNLQYWDWKIKDKRIASDTKVNGIENHHYLVPFDTKMKNFIHNQEYSNYCLKDSIEHICVIDDNRQSHSDEKSDINDYQNMDEFDKLLATMDASSTVTNDNDSDQNTGDDDIDGNMIDKGTTKTKQDNTENKENKENKEYKEYKEKIEKYYKVDKEFVYANPLSKQYILEYMSDICGNGKNRAMIIGLKRSTAMHIFFGGVHHVWGLQKKLLPIRDIWQTNTVVYIIRGDCDNETNNNNNNNYFQLFKITFADKKSRQTKKLKQIEIFKYICKFNILKNCNYYHSKSKSLLLIENFIENPKQLQHNNSATQIIFHVIQKQSPSQSQSQSESNNLVKYSKLEIENKFVECLLRCSKCTHLFYSKHTKCFVLMLKMRYVNIPKQANDIDDDNDGDDDENKNFDHDRIGNKDELTFEEWKEKSFKLNGTGDVLMKISINFKQCKMISLSVGIIKYKIDCIDEKGLIKWNKIIGFDHTKSMVLFDSYSQKLHRINTTQLAQHRLRTTRTMFKKIKPQHRWEGTKYQGILSNNASVCEYKAIRLNDLVYKWNTIF